MHLILMGAPGSGKGLYAVELKSYYGIPHISTGEIFRQAIEEQTEVGKIAQAYIDKGNLVPDEVTIEIVKMRLQKDDCKKGFLLDGFPRTVEQGKALTKMLAELNIKLNAVVDLEVDEELVVKRIVNRRSCPNCGKGYNLVNYPPKQEGICDICSTPLTRRKDDNEETVRSRLAVYHNQTQPLIDYYKELGLLVSVDSNGTIEGVTKDIINILEAK